MKKVNIPGPAIAGFAIVIVCLCGMLSGSDDAGRNIILIAACILVLALLFFFSWKSIYVEEKIPADDTRKAPKSKGKAAAERDSVHMRRMLDAYNDQLVMLRRKSRNGALYAGGGLVFFFIQCGNGAISFPVFVTFALICIFYGSWCVLTFYVNSDSPNAPAVAEKLNMSTLRAKIEETETAIWQNEVKEGSALKTISFEEEEEAVSDDGKVILETKRLFLREMNDKDYDALYAVLSDPENMQYYPYRFDEEKVRDWIHKNMDRYRLDGFGLWAVCLKDTGEVIGDCGLTIQNINKVWLPEIGYHIRRNCQHMGYATEAAMAVRDWAFANTDHQSLYSYCKSANTPSIKTAQSIGMHYDKEYKDESGSLVRVSVIRRDEIHSIAKIPEES